MNISVQKYQKNKNEVRIILTFKQSINDQIIYEKSMFKREVPKEILESKY